jgi:hypothetical protein
MEPFDHLEAHAHHVIAVFRTTAAAQHALDELRTEGINDGSLSILVRSGSDVPHDQDDEKVLDVAAGTVAGGALGFALGALAFGIPGIGTVVGAGLWTATAVGAALGATAGIEVSDYHHAWEGQYRSAIEGGSTLIAVSTDDPLVAAGAVERFQSADATQVDHFDRHGTVLDTPD